MGGKIAVAMSGGVDSSVAAVLLKEAGHEVIGVTMDFGSAMDCINSSSRVTSKGTKDCIKVARLLGIKLYSFDLGSELKERVINDFCKEYSRGRTPNPCVRCNQYLKFGILFKKAMSLGADFFATGHYCRVSGTYDKKRHKHFLLKKALDPSKDQSYFLYRLSQACLKRVLFPLGDYTKDRVRRLAEDYDLPVAGKSDSQEICFLPGADYRAFISNNNDMFTPKSMRPGLIVDGTGNVVGRHKGIAFYTVGQREGLGIALGYRAYISRINQRGNVIVIGKKEEVLKRSFLVKSVCFIQRPAKKNIAVWVRIRYNHKEALANVSIRSRNTAHVIFREPQFAITPGQSAVFYEKDAVIGGGIIDRVLE